MGTLLGTLQKGRVKPASIRGPIFVSASTVPRSVPIRGAARVLGLTHQRVHQLTQNEAKKRWPHRQRCGTKRTSGSRGRAEACARLRSRQLTGANPRLANGRVNSSLNA